MPYIPPMILPINTHTEVNCIIEKGVRYCEDPIVTKQDIGIILIATIAVVLWFIGWSNLFIERKYVIGNLVLWIPIIAVWYIYVI